MRSLLVSTSAALLLLASCGTATTPPPTTPPPATADTTTTAVPSPVSMEQVVYLLIEGQTRGPHVAPVLAGENDALLVEVLKALVTFSPPAPELSSQVPPQTRVLSANASHGVATIDVSADFAAADGTFSEGARLAQLVYTATRSPLVDAVLLLIEGETPESFAELGIDFSEPITRDTMRSFQGAVFIEEPPFGASLGGVVRGEASAQTSLEARVTDARGALVASVSLLDAAGDGPPATFAADVSYLVLDPQIGTLEVFLVARESASAAGVSYQVQLDPPVSLETSCSAGGLDVVAVPDPNLPISVDETRLAIIEAAASCDFGALGALASQAPFFTFSFGGGEDPARFWAQSESLGSPVTRRMVQLLQGPYQVEPAADDPVYIWPSIFFVTKPDEKDWEDLAGIYPPSEIDNFRDLGEYLGLRLGIGADATWRFSVTGD